MNSISLSFFSANNGLEVKYTNIKIMNNAIKKFNLIPSTISSVQMRISVLQNSAVQLDSNKGEIPF